EGVAPLAALDPGTQERRLMFAARVEQEPRARLDHRTQPIALEQGTDGRELGREARGERVEGVVVERQGDGPVTELRQDRQGVFQAVMREAVGVVAEAEHSESRMQANGPASSG